MAIAMTVEAILARHHPAPSYGTEPPICTWCEQNWPCEVAVVANDTPVLAVAQAAEALVEGLTNDTARARLAAFAGEGGIAWPDEPGVTLHKFGPCFAGTSITLDIFAEYESAGGILAEYPRLTPEQVAAGRDYWERHAPLFEAACWLSYTENAAFPSPEGEQLATLQSDVRNILGEREQLIALTRRVGRYVAPGICNACRGADCDAALLSTCLGWAARQLLRQLGEEATDGR